MKEKNSAEQKTRELTESSREEWRSPSFFKSLFMGRWNEELIRPFPEPGKSTPGFLEYLSEYKNFLQNEVDPDQIDRDGEIPKSVFRRLKELKAFALKIDRRYGGHGFTQAEYNDVMRATAEVDANVAALLSAHQSIGVPQPLILFGTEDQKEKYLRRISEGAISAFALTEEDVGSDPANLVTVVEETEDGYILNGEKLWTTNGTIAELCVVMARHADDDSISAFIVEMDWEGVKVENRCHFMGLRALYNGVISFRDVLIPRENLIGEKGKGLKIALVTLNTGRLALPAAINGSSAKALEYARRWCRQRVQWGKPIYQHEAVAHKLSDMTVKHFVNEAICELATALYDRGEDIRLEAAVAKLYTSERSWESIDDLLQLRGGRGYETADSLRERGEEGVPVERMFRDARINKIFEGSSEIMRLFIAREAVDEHLKISGIILDPKAGRSEKLRALPKIAFFYATWYPGLWLPSRGLKRLSKKLARQVFHGMLIHGPALEKKQVFLFRLVDIAIEIYAQAVASSYSEKMGKGEDIVELFRESSTRKIQRLFRGLWKNSDKKKYQLAKKLETDQYLWLEEGEVEVEIESEAFKRKYSAHDRGMHVSHG